MHQVASTQSRSRTSPGSAPPAVQDVPFQVRHRIDHGSTARHAVADVQSASRACGATTWGGCQVPVHRNALPVPSVRRQNPSVGQESEVIPPLVGSNAAAALQVVPFQRNHRPSWSTTTHIVGDTQSSPPLRSVTGSSAVTALQVLPFHRRTPSCGSSTTQNEADVHDSSRPSKKLL